MTDEKWMEVTEMAKKNFKGAELHLEDLTVETPDGQQKQGTREILTFKHPAGGSYRLVRENRPVVLEKKELYSHRAGQSAQAQYKFSETEFFHKLKVYRESGLGEWEEITPDKLGL